MFSTKLKIAAAAAFAFSLLGIGIWLLTRPGQADGAEPEKRSEGGGTLARKVMQQLPSVGDLASVLHINQRCCKVEFGAVPKSGTLLVELELYKDGRKTDFALRSGGLIFHDVPKPVTISLQAVDLDYLPLAGGQKGRCRVQLAWETDGIRTSSEDDIPKDQFDFSKVNSSAGFPATAGSPTEVPLFYLLTTTAGTFGGADTVKGIIEGNPKGKLLIAFLRLTK